MLEGKGVLPDVEAKQTYESLKAGQDAQMEKAAEIAQTLCGRDGAGGKTRK